VKGWNGRDIAYIAGLFDGEGSISIIHHRRGHRSNGKAVHELYVGIASTCSEVIDWLKRYLGFGLIHKKRCAGMPGVRKDIWYWETSCQAAENFLRLIENHAKIKRRHIEEALSFRNRQRKEGNDIAGQCLQLKRLNGRSEPCRLIA
jgi:hypothetical protein